jgi:hypothetical protein
MPDSGRVLVPECHCADLDEAAAELGVAPEQVGLVDSVDGTGISMYSHMRLAIGNDKRALFEEVPA